MAMFPLGSVLFPHMPLPLQLFEPRYLMMLGQALDLFRLDLGRYPTTDEGLQALREDPGIDNWDGPYVKKAIPKDPWKNDFHYQSPGDHGDYDLYSFGADNSSGGE